VVDEIDKQEELDADTKRLSLAQWLHEVEELLRVFPDMELSDLQKDLKKAVGKRGVAFTGVTGHGKSTLINNLFGRRILPTADVVSRWKLSTECATTQCCTEICVTDRKDDLASVTLFFVPPSEWSQILMKLSDKELARLYDTYPKGKKMITKTTDFNNIPQPIRDTLPLLGHYVSNHDHEDDDPVLTFLRKERSRKFEYKSSQDVLHILTAWSFFYGPFLSYILLEAPALDSGFLPGVVIFDLPGSGESKFSPMRARYRTMQLDSSRKAVLVCKTKIGENLVAAEVDDLKLYQLSDQCCFVRTKPYLEGQKEEYKELLGLDPDIINPDFELSRPQLHDWLYRDLQDSLGDLCGALGMPEDSIRLVTWYNTKFSPDHVKCIQNRIRDFINKDFVDHERDLKENIATTLSGILGRLYSGGQPSEEDFTVEVEKRVIAKIAHLSAEAKSITLRMSTFTSTVQARLRSEYHARDHHWNSSRTFAVPTYYGPRLIANETFRQMKNVVPKGSITLYAEQIREILQSSNIDVGEYSWQSAVNAANEAIPKKIVDTLTVSSLLVFNLPVQRLISKAFTIAGQHYDAYVYKEQRQRGGPYSWLNMCLQRIQIEFNTITTIEVTHSLEKLLDTALEKIRWYRRTHRAQIQAAEHLNLKYQGSEEVIRKVLRLHQLLVSSSSFTEKDPKFDLQEKQYEDGEILRILSVTPGIYNVPKLIEELSKVYALQKPHVLVLRSVGLYDECLDSLNAIIEEKLSLDISGNNISLEAIKKIKAEKIYASFTSITPRECDDIPQPSTIVCQYTTTLDPSLPDTVTAFLLFSSPTGLPGAAQDVSRMAAFLRQVNVLEVKEIELYDLNSWEQTKQQIAHAKTKGAVFIMYSGHGSSHGFPSISGYTSDNKECRFGEIYCLFDDKTPVVIILNCCLGHVPPRVKLNETLPNRCLIATATLPFSVALDAITPGSDSLYNQVLLNYFSEIRREKMPLVDLFTGAHVELNRKYDSEKALLVNHNFSSNIRFWGSK
jgi:hypothetical protein